MRRRVLPCALVLYGATCFACAVAFPLRVASDEADAQVIADASGIDAAPDSSRGDAGVDASDAAVVPPYVQAVQASKPIVYLRFSKTDVNVGTRITNEGSLPSYDGAPFALTYSTDCAFTDPASGCVVLDGAKSHVEVTGPAIEFRGNAKWTVEGWVKLSRLLAPDSGNDYPSLFSYLGPTSPPRTQYSLAFNVNVGVLVERYVTQTDSVSADSTISQDLKWHHVAGTYDGANVAVYRDGFLLKQVAHTPPFPTNPGVLSVGATKASATQLIFQLAATIDDVAVYDRALDEAELKSHSDAVPR